MRVSVASVPARLVGHVVVDLPGGATIEDLIERLRRENLGQGDIPDGQSWDLPDVREPGQFVILLNGRSVGSLAGMKTRLSDGDNVLLVIPAAGG